MILLIREVSSGVGKTIPKVGETVPGVGEAFPEAKIKRYCFSKPHSHAVSGVRTV
jgi:hypothetical protein